MNRVGRGISHAFFAFKKLKENKFPADTDYECKAQVHGSSAGPKLRPDGLSCWLPAGAETYGHIEITVGSRISRGAERC